VPFALPVKMKEDEMHKIKKELSRKLNLRTEVLHYDYNNNMLDPKYEKALVFGCHEKWEKIHEILDIK